MNFLDKIADKFNISGYAKEKKIAQQFMGISLTREDYNALKEQGTKSIHDSFLGKRINVYNERQVINESLETELTRKVINHFNEAGIIFDLDATENEDAKKIMMRAITFRAVNLDPKNEERQLISFGEHYDQDPEITALKQRYINKYGALQEIKLKTLSVA